jgi:nucleoside-diphosphate-sugar epimerase
LITGVGGFIGFNVAKYYSKNNNVIGIYRRQKPKIKNIKLLKMDLSKDDLNSILKKNKIKIDIVIHCSSKTPESKFKSSNIYLNNILQMKNILNIKQELKKLIFLSSVSVYGDIINTKYVSESYKGTNVNSYGKSKYKCEEILRDFAKRNKVSSYAFRLPGVVGLFSHSNFMSTLLKQIKNNVKINLFNPKSKFNNIIHVDFLIECIDFAINRKNNFSIFNIASTFPIQLYKIINILCKKFNYKNKISWNAKKNNSFCINLKKAKRFGFKFKNTKENIDRFILKN